MKSTQTPEKKPEPSAAVDYDGELWAVMGHSKHSPNDDPTLTIKNDKGKIITLCLSECKLLNDIIIPKHIH